MGKTKKVSDDEMSIEENQHFKKKAKKIEKNPLKKKQRPLKRVKSNIINSHKIMRNFSKNVNAKKTHRTLQQKQQIFNKIVQGLKGKSNISKKERKKNRVLLKKQLYKSLEIERTRRLSEEIEEKMQEEPQHQQKKKTKRTIDEKKQVENFKRLMGSGIQNLKKIVASNITNRF